MSAKAKSYIFVTTIIGLTMLVLELRHWQSQSTSRYLCYLLAGVLMAHLRVSLPAIRGTLSVNFLFILFGIVELTLPETLLTACAITAVQCLWRPDRSARAVQIVFNVAAVAIATVTAQYVFHALNACPIGILLRLILSAAVFFGANTLLVAAVIAVTENRPVSQVWRTSYCSSGSYYLSGAAVAALMSIANRYVGWQTALLIVPLVFLIYKCYAMYLARLEDGKQHVKEMAALQLRTIEALALAIEAKDHSGIGQMSRVQAYAVGVAEDMGLTSDEVEALRAASLLRNIGNLAVPEHIISKPGPLTPDEFEKIKIHPLVGAELLERVQFPYPVVPIVRSHHERWDGCGYPAGLAGEKIPIGARILAVVDYMDAVASPRPYRAALPLEDAFQKVADESGKSFDPKVVSVLKKRFLDLERKAQATQQWVQLSTQGSSSSSQNPQHAPEIRANQVDFLRCIAEARQEVQALFELAQDLGNSLSLDETLSVLAVRLRKIVPCDAMAIYIRRNEVLVPEYVTGDDFRLFSSLEIPWGQGLSGWVAENRKPILNGNPSSEPGYLKDPNRFSTLRSALVVPLEGLGGVLGVLSLYQAQKNGFTSDHLRILLAISSKVALSVENALRYRQAEDSASLDFLTSLPNARSLFLHLDAELARARRSNMPVAVLVCDLDGFKQVNDRFGHLEGNKLLRIVSRGLKDDCREYDYVARMGGDEFVLVLPGLSLEDLESRCARFRDIVLDAGRQVCGCEITSISIGHGFYPEDGGDAEELLSKADARMYQHKNRKAQQTSSAARAWEAEPVQALQ